MQKCSDKKKPAVEPKVAWLSNCGAVQHIEKYALGIWKYRAFNTTLLLWCYKVMESGMFCVLCMYVLCMCTMFHVLHLKKSLELINLNGPTSSHAFSLNVPHKCLVSENVPNRKPEIANCRVQIDGNVCVKWACNTLSFSLYGRKLDIMTQHFKSMGFCHFVVLFYFVLKRKGEWKMKDLWVDLLGRIMLDLE